MSEQPKRDHVQFRYDAIIPGFLKAMAEIGYYASEKYGSWDQYLGGRLECENAPINHIYEHLRQYAEGEPYDHFDGDPRRHLVAVAYNAMMEWAYHSMFGFKAHPFVKAKLTNDPRGETRVGSCTEPGCIRHVGHYSQNGLLHIDSSGREWGIAP